MVVLLGDQCPHGQCTISMSCFRCRCGQKSRFLKNVENVDKKWPKPTVPATEYASNAAVAAATAPAGIVSTSTSVICK